MKVANATNLNRKSGGAQGRDLQFTFGQSERVVDEKLSLRSGRDDKVQIASAV
jgi:hypothetical protein